MSGWPVLTWRSGAICALSFAPWNLAYARTPNFEPTFAVRVAIDADRVAHEALHADERQARTDEKRELLAAIAGSREGAS